MAIQTSFASAPARGIAGDYASAEDPRVTISRLAEVAIAQGLVVTQGTAPPAESYGHPGQCKIPTSEAEVTAALGVALRNLAKEGADYAAEDAVSIARKGVVWVYCEDAVDYGDPVYVRVTAGVGETAGMVRSDGDSGDAFVLPGAEFRETITGAGLVPVALDC